MSHRDTDTAHDERRPLTVQNTSDHLDRSKNLYQEKRKKQTRYCIIGSVILVAIVLIIVLSVTLSRGDDGV